MCNQLPHKYRHVWCPGRDVLSCFDLICVELIAIAKAIRAWLGSSQYHHIMGDLCKCCYDFEDCGRKVLEDSKVNHRPFKRFKNERPS